MSQCDYHHLGPLASMRGICVKRLRTKKLCTSKWHAYQYHVASLLIKDAQASGKPTNRLPMSPSTSSSPWACPFYALQDMLSMAHKRGLLVESAVPFSGAPQSPMHTCKVWHPYPRSALWVQFLEVAWVFCRRIHVDCAKCIDAACPKPMMTS